MDAVITYGVITYGWGYHIRSTYFHKNTPLPPPQAYVHFVTLQMVITV